MSSRRIKYGYKIVNGEIVIDEKEGIIVKRIFNEYINGMIFKEIADVLIDEHIPYVDNIVSWNKNKIARIIENEIYTGKNGYEKLVNEEVFKRANNLCKTRRQKLLPRNSDIFKIRDKVTCYECGKRYFRKINKNQEERWFCENHCSVKNKVSDEGILTGIKIIVDKITECPDIILKNDFVKTYFLNNQIINSNNFIYEMLSSKKPDYALGKKMLLENMALKYQACIENKGMIYSEKVLDAVKKYRKDKDIEIINKIIEKIFILSDGSIMIKFINNSNIKEKEDNNGGKTTNAKKGSSKNSIKSNTSKRK